MIERDEQLEAIVMDKIEFMESNSLKRVSELFLGPLDPEQLSRDAHVVLQARGIKFFRVETGQIIKNGVDEPVATSVVFVSNRNYY